MAYEKCAFKPASSSAKNVIIGDSSAAPSQPQATVALTQPCPHQVVNTSSTRQGRRDPRHKRWLQRKALTAYRYSYRYSSAASASAFEHFSSLLIQPLRMTFELFCRINRYERLSPLRLLIKELDPPFQANSGESGSVVRHSHDGVMTVIAILARLSGELGRVRVAAVNAAVLAGNPCPRLPCANAHLHIAMIDMCKQLRRLARQLSAFQVVVGIDPEIWGAALALITARGLRSVLLPTLAARHACDTYRHLR